MLPAGDYNIKVFESFTGTNGTFTNVATELISFPAYSYNYDVEPVIQGEPLVGQTLKIATHSWTPEPTEVAIWWFRCKKTTAKYPDLYQVKLADIPMSWGYKFDNNADCAYLNANGTLADAPDLGPVNIRNMSSVKSYAVQGFTSYTITTADLGYYITASIDLGGGRYFWNATTSVVEQKTAPVNQVAPTSSFKKTKKIKTLTVGVQVSATAGTWKWANTTTYQWFSCSKRQKSATSINAKQCKSIKRATKANYKVKKTDKRRFLVAQVTATNELGSSVIYANSLKKIS